MAKADDDFDTVVDKDGQHRWVYNSPSGGQRLGPQLHKSRAAAIRAGKQWLAERSEK